MKEFLWRVRYFLIVKLVGNRSVVMNSTIKGSLTVSHRNNAIISGCTIYGDKYVKELNK